ncbi:MAG: hypothetical protein R3F34_04520 [Planctomycetota bacterium]
MNRPLKPTICAEYRPRSRAAAAARSGSNGTINVPGIAISVVMGRNAAAYAPSSFSPRSQRTTNTSTFTYSEWPMTASP